MRKIEKFWVPWHKEEGYLGAYCHSTKEMVIQDLEQNYCLISQRWPSLRREGWKIIQVTFKPVEKKARK